MKHGTFVRRRSELIAIAAPEKAIKPAASLVWNLVSSDAGEWLIPELVDLLNGQHGVPVAKTVFLGCIGGFEADGSSIIGLGVTGSLALWCLEAGRLDVLRAVVERCSPGFVAPAGVKVRGATTHAGIYLDLLSGAAKPSGNNFLTWLEPSRQSARYVQEAAELLFDVDPTHKGIDEHAGTALGAHITRLQMLRSIRESAPVAAPSGQFPAGRARLRGV